MSTPTPLKGEYLHSPASIAPIPISTKLKPPSEFAGICKPEFFEEFHSQTILRSFIGPKRDHVAPVITPLFPFPDVSIATVPDPSLEDTDLLAYWY